ncbi:MAG: M24 family metallopeptidase [Pseudomonadota bacterium]
MKHRILVAALTVATALCAHAGDAPLSVADYSARPKVMNMIVEKRLETVLPRMMRETGIDMWLVIAREYNNDPVFLSLVPKPRFTARRTTMLMFYDRGEGAGVERLTISRYPLGTMYEAAWEGGELDEQWQRLGALVAERDPKNIAINVSDTWPVADGLSHHLHQKLTAVLDASLSARLTSSEALVVRWMETRIDDEVAVWQRAVGLARQTIATAFSAEVITPGVTTLGDVAWFIRSEFERHGLAPWFHPDVNLQRPGKPYPADADFFGEYEAGLIIQRGDVLHTDVGLCYLGLCTDTQEMGYVLRVDENDAPAGLRDALAVGNRWQDILTGAFKTGRTGNEILAEAQRQLARTDIVSSIYTHPLGLYGHAPGPTIGMWDNQGPTPGRGDWPLHAMTGYAIEGNVKVAVPEFDDQLVQMKLEQSALFDGDEVIYLAGRQTRLHLVR